MLDTNVGGIPRGFGLSALEQISVKAAATSLPRGWHVVFEATDSREIYARVVPPWNAGLSVFLIDRESHGVILTDNISHDAHPVISVVCTVQDAIDCVVAIVSGTSEEQPSYLAA